ncbi:glycerophosphodiester phosphodiesterase family protein [Daejeonella oryzae]|uniref:glycerophosphodiester phosphodiesterase family protein n=1 Tax=Daejeonella oryzae TaxID=1122943 RepID=UPI0004131AB5|nr:glycerophosphodiester phosphodiesterase family protein [Daejeonella oryzae]
MTLKQQLFIPAIFVFMMIGSCKIQKSAQQAALPAFDTEGHRGARGLMPENTIPAMYKAIQLGVTTLEMDVHISRDNQVILSHDDHINSLFTLSVDGKEISKAEAEKFAFYQMDYDAIKKFDVGSKFYDKFPKQQKLKVHIPLLTQLIDSVQNYLVSNGKPQVFYNIETKSKPEGDKRFHPEPEQFVKLLMDVLEKKKITPWVIIQSFDPRTLRVLHDKYPNIKTAYLVESNSLKNNLTELGFTPTIYSPNSKLVTSDLVKQVHEKGIKIIPWTVNTKQQITRLKSFGVDGIISDYPDLFNQ